MQSSVDDIDTSLRSRLRNDKGDMASSAGKRTNEKVKDDPVEVENTELRDLEESTRVVDAELCEREQIRELFDALQSCRKDIAFLMSENKQLREDALAAQMAATEYASSSQQPRKQAKGSYCDVVKKSLSQDADSIIELLPADDKCDLPTTEKDTVVIENDDSLAQPISEQEIRVKTEKIPENDEKSDGQKMGRLKASTLPMLEAPAKKNFENFSFRFTSALGALEGNWLEVLLMGQGTSAEQERLFSALTCALKDDTALNLVKRHRLAASSSKATDAWKTLEKAYAGHAPHRIQLLLTRMSQEQGKTESMERYTTRVVNAASQLTAVGQPQADTTVCHLLLKGVRRPDYEHAVHQLLHDEEMMKDLTATVDYLVVAGTRTEEGFGKRTSDKTVGQAAFAARIGLKGSGRKTARRRTAFKKQRDFSNVRCFTCGVKGHIASECPKRCDEEPSALLASEEPEQDIKDDQPDEPICFMASVINDTDISMKLEQEEEEEGIDQQSTVTPVLQDLPSERQQQEGGELPRLNKMSPWYTPPADSANWRWDVWANDWKSRTAASAEDKENVWTLQNADQRKEGKATESPWSTTKPRRARRTRRRTRTVTAMAAAVARQADNEPFSDSKDQLPKLTDIVKIHPLPASGHIDHMINFCGGGSVIELENHLEQGGSVGLYTHVEISAKMRRVARARLTYLADKFPQQLPYHAVNGCFVRLPYDVRKITPRMLNALPRVNLAISGSPCQGFSVAGEQRGWEDNRSLVFPVVIRMMAHLHRRGPLTYILENVPGALLFSELVNSLGQPLQVDAAQLGGASRRETLIWTNVDSHQNLTRSYNNSKLPPISVKELLILLGLYPEWREQFEGQVLPKILARIGSWTHSYRFGKPGSGMLLHHGRPKEASADIKEAGVGITPGTTAGFGIEEEDRCQAVGSCIGKAILRWLWQASYKKTGRTSNLMALTAANSRASRSARRRKNRNNFPDLWIYDSGASAHMTSCRNDFWVYRDLPTQLRVKGIGCMAVGIGCVRCRMPLQGGGVQLVELKDVYYVPGLDSQTGSHKYTRLFSQHAAHTASPNASTHFKPSGAAINLNSQMSVQIFPLQKMGLYGLRSAIIKDITGESLVALTAGPVNIDGNLLHQRLGHLHQHGVCRALDHPQTKMKTPGDMQPKFTFCRICALTKSTEQPRSRQLNDLPTKPMERVGLDIWKASTVSLQGNQHALGAIDYATSLAFVWFLPTKDKAAEAIEKLFEQCKQMGHPVQSLRLDNDAVFHGNLFQKHCRRNNVKCEWTAPYSPHQNGKQERTWRTLAESTSAMLLHAGQPRSFWEFALSTAVFIHNRVPRLRPNGIPVVLAGLPEPDLSKLRVWGCPAYVHIPDHLRRKMDSRAYQGIFVGYATDAPAWKIWNPTTNSVIYSRNVEFDERWRDDIQIAEEGNNVERLFNKEDFQQSVTLNISEHEQESSHARTPTTEIHTPDIAHKIVEDAELENQNQETESEAMREQNSGEKNSSEYNIIREDQDSQLTGLMGCVSSESEPANLKEALSSDKAQEWWEATIEEYNALEKNNTWELALLPPGRKAIGNKWLYKLKRGADGKVYRYKARLVAKGCSQTEGIDYNETFAPTVKFTTIRTLLAVAVSKSWHIHQVDVNTAFLYAPVTEEIYMRQPQGFVQPGNEHKVLRLKKSIYGLKQSPRNWYDTLKLFFIENHFRQIHTDPGAFVQKDENNNTVGVILVYVDDMVMAYKDLSVLEEMKKKIASRFDIKDLGECAWLLGIAVKQDRSDGTVTLNQQNFIEDLAAKYGMTNAAAVYTPAVVGSGTSKIISTDLEEPVIYQSLVGSLLYLMVATRPDIADAVNKLCRQMAKPTVANLKAAKRVLAYVLHTKHLSIIFRRGTKLEVVGYSDADWAGDDSTRRSTTGYIFMIGDGCISWKSQLQRSVALSTAEAEYMALAATSQEALFIRQLMEELGATQTASTVIYEDNQSAIAMAKNAVTSSRAKHIDIRFHFVRDLINTNIIKLVYKPTTQMLADILTKSLLREIFEKLRKYLLQ